MEEEMEYAGYDDLPPEGVYDLSEEDYADPEALDQESPAEDIGERIDGLLEQIGVEKTYGSMGDYYVAEAGCYAFPGEDVFFHFVGEAERSGWTAASNGCYVPSGSLEAYENWLSSGLPEELEETEELPPPVTQEDLAGLGETLQAIYEQDAVYHTASVVHMEQTDQNLSEINDRLTVISIALIVLCVFVAIICGARFSDTFFGRMRAG